MKTPDLSSVSFILPVWVTHFSFSFVALHISIGSHFEVKFCISEYKQPWSLWMHAILCLCRNCLRNPRSTPTFLMCLHHLRRRLRALLPPEVFPPHQNLREAKMLGRWRSLMRLTPVLSPNQWNASWIQMRSLQLLLQRKPNRVYAWCLFFNAHVSILSHASPWNLIESYSQDTKPACKYGEKCYQKSTEHRQQFSHPEASGASPHQNGKQHQPEKSLSKVPSLTICLCNPYSEFPSIIIRLISLWLLLHRLCPTCSLEWNSSCQSQPQILTSWSGTS